MKPYAFCTDRMMRVAVNKEMLKEAHILQAEKWDLVLRLMDDLRRRWVFAF